MLTMIPSKRRHVITRSWTDPVREMWSMMDHFFDERLAVTVGFNVDVQETEESYEVKAELPGIPKEQMHVEYQDDMLFIMVTDEKEVRTEDDRYHHEERIVWEKNRGIYLPNMNVREAVASLENGVLLITIPKISVRKHEITIH